MLRTLIILMLFLGGQTAFAQYTAEQREKIKEATMEDLNELMELANQRKYDAFARKMVYTGRNPNRNLQTKVNFQDPHEKLFVINSVNKIKHYLDKSALWHASNFRIIEGFDSDLFRWDVEYTLLKGKTRTFVATFALLKGEYLFCQME